jgi:hypothetical protein
MKAANGSSKINESPEMDFSENVCDFESAKDAVHQVQNSDGDVEIQGTGSLLSQLSEAPRREIEDLVGKLMALHKKLQTDGERIQRDIEEYTNLNQRVRQLTTIIIDSVGKLPDPRLS